MGDLPDHVEGGQIVRDDAGKPTGVFVSHKCCHGLDTDRVTARQCDGSDQCRATALD